MIWGALIIPILLTLLVVVVQHRRILWWEVLLMFGAPLILIGLTKVAVESFQTQDTEFWTGYAVRAEYYEAWNERVECEHTKYKEVPYTDDKGIRRTRKVEDGTKHSYDVEDHSPYWQLVDNNDFTVSITSRRFEELAKRWESREFVELHRDFHSNDGDKYVATWDEQDVTMEVITTLRSYENRVAAANLPNYQPIDDETVEKFGLFAYPKLTRPEEGGLFDFSGKYRVDSILGDGGPTMADANALLNRANAKLGQEKQVRIWVLLYQDQPLEAAIAQESLWMGGNKNEFVVCIGIDKDYQVQWAQAFSWTLVEELKVAVRNLLLDQDELDLLSLAAWLEKEVGSRFIRRHFSEFSYLTVDPPLSVVLLVYLLTLLVSGGVSWWCVYNDMHAR